MNDPSLFLHGLIEQGAKVASMAELLLVYRLLQNFDERDTKVNRIEREVGAEMHDMIEALKTIKNNTTEINDNLQEIKHLVHRRHGQDHDNS